jgi:hypothetical protein
MGVPGTAIHAAAVVGGMPDVGDLLVVDRTGRVSFFPGTVMTLIPTSAIVRSFRLPSRKTADAA